MHEHYTYPIINGQLNRPQNAESVGFASAFAYGADALLAHGYVPLPVRPYGKEPGFYSGLTGKWSNETRPGETETFAQSYFKRDHIEPGTPFGKNLSGWSLITRERLTSYDLTAEGWDAEQFGPYSLGHDFDMWKRMPHNGIGVKCGDGLVGIDIDSDDRDVIDAVMSVIGDHEGVEVIKRGRRGFTMFFFAQGISSTRIDFEGRVDGIDVLSTGKQSVLPPSIHPTTAQPYHWQSERTLFDTNLVELPTLTADMIDEIKSRLERDGITIKVGRPPRADVEFTGGGNTYTNHVNDRAMRNIGAWVEDLGLYRGKWVNGAYRAVPTWRAGGTGRPASQRKLNISISPGGIKDFGTEEGFTPISLVARARNCDWREAQSWLAARVGVEKMPPLPDWWLKAKEDRDLIEEDFGDVPVVEEPDAPAIRITPVSPELKALGYSLPATAAEINARKLYEAVIALPPPRVPADLGTVSIDEARQNGRDFLVGAVTEGSERVALREQAIAALIAEHDSLINRRASVINGIIAYRRKCPTPEMIEESMRWADVIEHEAAEWHNTAEKNRIEVNASTSTMYQSSSDLSDLRDIKAFQIHLGTVPVGIVDGDERQKKDVDAYIENVVVAGMMGERAKQIRVMAEELAGKYDLHVSRGYTGTGKTTAMIEAVARDSGKGVLMLTPTNRLGYEVEAKLLGAGLSAGLLPGYSAKVSEEVEARNRALDRPYPDRGCRRYGEGVSLQKAGGQWASMCKGKDGSECPYIEDCPIQVMRDKIKAIVTHTVMVHTMVCMPKNEILGNFDVLFFDESRHPTFQSDPELLSLSKINAEFIRDRFEEKDADGKTTEQAELESQISDLERDREQAKADGKSTKRFESKIAQARKKLDAMPKRIERLNSRKGQAQTAASVLAKQARSVENGGLCRADLIDARTENEDQMKALMEEIDHEMKLRHGELADSPDKQYTYSTKDLRALRVLVDMVMNLTRGEGGERTGRIVRRNGELVLRPVNRIKQDFLLGKVAIYSNATPEPDAYIVDAFTYRRHLVFSKVRTDKETGNAFDAPAREKIIDCVPVLIKSDTMTIPAGKNVTVQVHTNAPVNAGSLGLRGASSTFDITSINALRNLAVIKGWEERTYRNRKIEIENRLLLALYIRERTDAGKKVLVVAGGRLRDWLTAYFIDEAGGVPANLVMLPRFEAVGRDEFKNFDNVIVLGKFRQPKGEAHEAACAIDDNWTDPDPEQWTSHEVLEWHSFSLLLQALERARTVIDHERPMTVDVFVVDGDFSLPISHFSAHANIAFSSARHAIIMAELAENLDVYEANRSSPIENKILPILMGEDRLGTVDVPSETGAWLLSRQGFVVPGMVSQKTATEAVAHIRKHGLPEGFKAFTADMREQDGTRPGVKAQTFIVADGVDPRAAIAKLTGMLVVGVTEVSVVEAQGEKVERTKMDTIEQKSKRIAEDLLATVKVVAVSKDGLKRFHADRVPARFIVHVAQALKKMDVYRMRGMIEGEDMAFMSKKAVEEFRSFCGYEVGNGRITRRPKAASGRA